MSEIITNKLTGKTAAGNVTITSEGGSATMQLQQGVAKAFCHFSTSTTQDSFNVASTVDAGTGQYKSTYTNNMSNAEQSVTTNGFRDSDQYIGNRSNDNATTHHQINCFTRGSATRVDTDTAIGVIHGDLA